MAAPFESTAYHYQFVSTNPFFPSLSLSFFFAVVRASTSRFQEKNPTRFTLTSLIQDSWPRCTRPRQSSFGIFSFLLLLLFFLAFPIVSFPSQFSLDSIIRNLNLNKVRDQGTEFLSVRDSLNLLLGYFLDRFDISYRSFP